MKRAKFCQMAVSLGGVESVLSYPVKMSHAVIPPEERGRLGIMDNLIRLSFEGRGVGGIGPCHESFKGPEGHPIHRRKIERASGRRCPRPPSSLRWEEASDLIEDLGRQD
jgi:hypothetical protein